MPHPFFLMAIGHLIMGLTLIAVGLWSGVVLVVAGVVGIIVMNIAASSSD